MEKKRMILEVIKFNIDSLYHLYGNLDYVSLEELESLNKRVGDMIDSIVEKVKEDRK